MNKKNNGKGTLIEYLNSNIGKDILRQDIVRDTGISNSRLSELIKELRSDGYDLIAPNRSGIVRLERTDGLVHDVTPRDIRLWLIILALSKLESATYIELIFTILSVYDSHYPYPTNSEFDTNYTDSDIINHLKATNPEINDLLKDFLPLPTLRKDLNHLQKIGWIEQKREHRNDGIHYVYSLSEKSPAVLYQSGTTLDNLMVFYDNYKDSISYSAPLNNILKKAKGILDWESDESPIRVYGKTNQIDDSQIDVLYRFIQYPYKTNILSIDYKGQSGNEKRYTVYSGLLFYSVETNRFYLMCRNTKDDRVMTLRLDRICSACGEAKKNDQYRSPEFMTLYETMFSTAYDPETYHVKVLFEDFGNISERLDVLHKKRIHSKLYRTDYISPDIPHTIVYEDDLRGLYDFARFLRGFGKCAIVLEPDILRDIMMDSYKKVIKNYGIDPDEKQL